MAQLKKIDAEGRMYVLKSGSGVTCLGFDVAADRTRMYMAALNRPVVEDLPVGTEAAYNFYLEAEKQYIASEYCRTHTTFDPKTPQAVQDALEAARHSRTRVRVFYGHEDGRDWHEENDVEGYVGRTCGPLKSPILVHNRQSTGGCCILTACIVKIVETSGKRVLYQHPQYSPGVYEIRPAMDEGYAEGVWIDGKLHAQFRKAGQAARWIKKMRGE